MQAPAPITAVIAEDEAPARKRLRDLLGGVPGVEVLGECADGPSAIQAVDRLQPDVLFLDLEMPGCDGLEVARRITHQPAIVFTTAHNRYAVAAFELGAIDYLLKPFGAERLAATLERVRAAFGEPAPPAADRLADALSRGPMTRLFVRNGRAIVPVAVATIVRFEAVGDYAAVHAGGAPHLVHVSLGRLEERLDPARFVRIHRGHLVNLDHVASFTRHPDGRIVARLRDGAELPVSRAKAQALRGLAS